MTQWAVTLNVGGGPGNAPARSAGMIAWIDSAMQRDPALVFAQEVTDEWLQYWPTEMYDVTSGFDRGWKIRSVLITKKSLAVTQLGPADEPNLHYHGSYVAAARWNDSPIGPVVLASVHASPSPADPERYGWKGSRPVPRGGGGDPRWKPRQLWDSDLLLATLHRMSPSGNALLAAGDFNEAAGYDYVDGRKVGTWGEEYVTRAAEYRLTDWLTEVWGEERATRDGLQLDRVIASQPALNLLSREPLPHVDDAWRSRSESLSDHAAIWFALSA